MDNKDIENLTYELYEMELKRLTELKSHIKNNGKDEIRDRCLDDVCRFLSYRHKCSVAYKDGCIMVVGCGDTSALNKDLKKLNLL